MRETHLRCAAVVVLRFTVMRRSFLRTVARGLIGVVLMTQMIISAYACPAMSLRSAVTMQMPASSASTDERGTANADMPMTHTNNCDDMAGAMDTSSPNLCGEHCKYGQQSDHAPTLNAPEAVLTALYAMPLVPETAPPARPSAATLSALVAASPPRAILHCVHRI